MPANRANAQTSVSRPFLITFSGIDGAGKTTQIERVTSCLEKQGLRVLRLSFWDHVAVWPNMRAGVGERAVKPTYAEQMAERSFAPKNSKHVRKWYLTVVRSGLYTLDVGRLHRLLASPRLRNADVVIFDRYIYDQIANIYSQSVAAHIYAKTLLKLAPIPDLAFILDASPIDAFSRKPEYPLDFMYRNRRSFLQLKEIAPQLVVIPDASAEDVTNEIYAHIRRSLFVQGFSSEEKTEVVLDNAVVRLQSSCRVQNDPTTRI